MQPALVLCRKIALFAALSASLSFAGCVADSGPMATPALNAATAAAVPAATSGDVATEEGSAGDAADQGDVEPAARPAPQTQMAAAMVPPPRRGSPVYRCGGGRSLTIENRRSAVTLLDPDGETMILPASPVGQSSRYGKKPYALVIEGGEVLYVKPSQAPFACRR